VKIKKLKLSEITPYPDNPRVPRTAIEAIASSIKAYGYAVPIVVDKKNVIISGHNRYEALKLLGKRKAECVVVDLTPEKARAFRLADNKTHEMSTWDYSLLISELRTLTDVETIRMSFPDTDIDRLLLSSAGAGTHHGVPTDTKLLKANIKEASKMGDQSEKRRGRVVDVECDSCQAHFGIDVTDVARRIKRAATLPIPEGSQVVVVPYRGMGRS
jgi:hypothetical protein